MLIQTTKTMRTPHIISIKTTVIITIALTIFSCSSSIKVTSLGEGFDEVYTERQSAEEILRIPKDSVTYAVIVDDLLCLFDNHRNREHTPTIRISEISSPEDYKGFIEYGIEAEQVAMPFFNQSGGKISIYDPLLGKVSVLNVQEAYQEEGYEPVFKNTAIISQRVCPFGDRVVFINSFAFEGNEPLVMISDENWSTKQRDNLGTYLNVMSGVLFTDHEQTRIGYARREIPELVIFDNKAKPLFKLTFPHTPWRFQKFEQNDGSFEYLREINQNFKECVYTGCGGEDLFSLVYDDEKGNDQVVLIFNWEGDIVDGFRTDGTIQKVSLSKDEKSLYIWERIGEDDVLNRYSLKNTR